MSKKKRNKSGQAIGSGAVATEFRNVSGSRPQGFSVSEEPRENFFTGRYFEWLALAIASIFAHWILTARLAGVSVSVLIDEYSYVLDAHYRALTEAYYPNHLFQLVYSITKTCGPEFYSCARGINALFVVASGVVIYALAKYISGKKWVSAIVWLGCVFGSFGTYTAYFMPEAIFNFFMVLFFFGLIRLGNSGRVVVWAALGAVLGIASLAKPHALFVVPALVIYIFLATRATSTHFPLQSIKRIGVFLASLLVSKLGIGYLIAGPKALSLFGSYGGVTVDSNFVSSSASLVGSTLLAESTISNALTTSWGQTLMMTIILGLSLAVAITGLLSSWTKDSIRFSAFKFRTLFAIALLNMMAVTALFEAWQGLTNWMHTRYSSYLIPLALIVLVEAFTNSHVVTNKILKRAVVGTFLILSTIALITAAMPYGANWIDAPDFRAHIDNPAFSSFAIVVAIVLAIWWIWKEQAPMLAGLIFAVLAAIGSGTYISTFLVQNFGQDTTYDHLGRVLRDYIPSDELSQTVLVGDNNSTMERALFASLSGSARAVLAPAEGLDLTELGTTNRWLVKVGEPVINDLGEPTIQGRGYALYSLSDSNSLVPRKNEYLGATSLCASGDSAGWSCGSETLVSLTGPLPERVRIDIVLEVSEAATKGEIEFAVGDSSVKGTLPEGIFTTSLSFNNSTSSESMIVRFIAPPGSEISADEKLVRVISINRFTR
jgi:phosphoglycerol transferase